MDGENIPVAGCEQESYIVLAHCNAITGDCIIQIGSRGKVFITYFAVSKAIDSVWVNRLFYQLRNLGVVGTMWRLLYKMYADLMCRVRMGDALFEWYHMQCGIHQGRGGVSLISQVHILH